MEEVVARDESQKPAAERAPHPGRTRPAVTQPLAVAELPDALLKIPTAGALLGVSVSTVNRLIASGALEAVRRGTRCTRLRAADVTRLAREGWK